MKCKYCDDNENIYDDKVLSLKGDGAYSGFSVYIIDSQLQIDGSADTFEPNYTEIEININFCPMCGKKIKKED